MHVADEGHRDEVGHDAAGGEDPEAALAVAHDVAQPADDLLLDERADRPGVPDVDALLGHLGEDLAGHGGEQRRRGEVAERARVIGAHRVRRDARRELVEHGLQCRGIDRRRRGPARRARRTPAGARRTRRARPSPVRTRGRTGSRARSPRSPRRRRAGPRATLPRRERRSARARDASSNVRSARISARSLTGRWYLPTPKREGATPGDRTAIPSRASPTRAPRSTPRRARASAASGSRSSCWRSSSCSRR